MGMNIETGKLTQFATEEEFKRAMEEQKLIEINPEKMTKKQREALKVSLRDHRSKLGKELTQARSLRGLTKNQKRNLKRKYGLK